MIEKTAFSQCFQIRFKLFAIKMIINQQVNVAEFRNECFISHLMYIKAPSGLFTSSQMAIRIAFHCRVVKANVA